MEARKAQGGGRVWGHLKLQMPSGWKWRVRQPVYVLESREVCVGMEVQRWASGSKVVRPPEAGPAQPEGAGHCWVLGRGPRPVLSGGILEEGPQS